MPQARRISANTQTASEVLKEKTAKAALVAKDAVANLLEFINSSSRMAFLTVKECERELDKLELEIDEQLPSAITRVGERKARELLSCLRFITDLERIGDLSWWIAQRLNRWRPDVPEKELSAITSMTSMLENMLADLHRGFLEGDVGIAQSVIARDREMDDLRRSVFTSQLDTRTKANTPDSVEILFITQALERAGDHATNLAEELIHLVEGRSVRHLPKKVTEM